MIHLGDITKISGYTAPIVDCIIGGSPCQDLSIAGKRAGLDGERSGLFMEQIRIIKEMRSRNDGTTDIRPRYMVWENVPGAFSSNRGEDFRIVLEETAKVADENAVIPEPPKGKWTTSGCIMGDGWSIAWRVLDAQFWGVPQRRRRIALVADFGGQSAPEILFVRKGLYGHTEQGKPKREATPSDASGSTGATDCIGVDIYNTALTGDKACPLTAEGHSSTGTCPKVMTAYTLKTRGGCEGGGKGALIQTDKSATLSTLQDQTLFQPVYALDRASFNQGKNAQFDFEVSDKGINSPLVAKGPSAVCYWDGTQVAGTLTANNANGCQRMPDKDNFNCVIQAHTCTPGGEPAVCYVTSSDGDIAGTLDASYYKGTGTRMGRERTYIAYCIGNGQANDAAQPEKELCKTLNCMVDPMKVCIAGARYTVRRLTPLECERLQGFPDGWTDIGEWKDTNGKVRKTSDAARYKALGNSIALPPWKWVLKRLCACYERDATMASLFDGIGGFPYIWEQINGKGSCLWASEIEDFPIAVTKERIR